MLRRTLWLRTAKALPSSSTIFQAARCTGPPKTKIEPAALSHGLCSDFIRWRTPDLRKRFCERLPKAGLTSGRCGVAHRRLHAPAS